MFMLMCPRGSVNRGILTLCRHGVCHFQHADPPSDFGGGGGQRSEKKRDWWGINKQDQTFSVFSQYSFQRFGSLRGEGGMKNVSGEFTALSLTVQPLCHS